MAASREVIYLNDFSGGLNLTTQLQTLRQNESPDCLNVDFGYRGGFTIRGGFQSQDYDTILNGAYFLGSTYFGNDVVLLVATDAGGSLLSWNGTTITDTTQNVTDSTTAHVRFASFNSKAYLANARTSGNIVMYSWDGTTLTALGSTFNNDYTTPNQGDMPDARLIAAHNGYMWVADTVESGTRFPHRVRFSHVQQPEDWAQADYFDVAPGDDGDPVTALVPFRDFLLVFKMSSVYAVYGYSKAEFFVERVATVGGVADPRAVTTNAGVCYWYSGDGHVMAFNGKNAAPLTENLRWWSDIGKINHQGNHNLVWGDGRLWLALEAGSGEDENYWLFVWDPNIKALTRYDKNVTSMFHWERLDAEHCPLFLLESDSNLYRYDRGYDVDTIDAGAGPVNTRIEGYYRTSWITAGETATKKRWKRPRITAAAEADTTVRLAVYHDFQEEVTVKTSELVIETGSVSLWGTMNWGDDWSSGQDDFYEFSRMPSAGSGYAVQFKFTSPDNPGRWWVDSVALPFRRKSVR